MLQVENENELPVGESLGSYLPTGTVTSSCYESMAQNPQNVSEVARYDEGDCLDLRLRAQGED